MHNTMVLIESFSGIRGVYSKDLTDNISVRYAYAFSKLLKGKEKEEIKVVIGRDTRISGEELRMSLIEGLECNIIDVGTLPTAAIENAVREYKAKGGIIITASHNEPEFNGFKFLDKEGAVLNPEDSKKVIDAFHEIKDIDEEKFLANYLYKKNDLEHIQEVTKLEHDGLALYKKFVLSFLNKKDRKAIKKSKIKIVVDPNGGTGIIAKEIFDELGINADYVNMEKGKFKRKIEPNKESLKYLQKEIRKYDAEFAAGFDCDADRVEIMLDDGKLVSGNQILALIVDEMLSEIKYPEEETIVVNDATSYVVKEITENYNSKWEEVEVGETNVVNTMIGFDSPIGGEGSNGGIIFPPSRCRDGILTIVYLLKIIAKRKRSLKELVLELPRYYYIKEKIKLKQDFTKIRGKVIQDYLDEGFTVEETGDDTGGLKAIKDNSWVWFRQSKTEDKVLRIISDSKDEKVAEELLKQAKKIAK